MKTKLIFIRHAQSEARAKNIVQGVGLDIPLTPLGIEQAGELVGALKEIPFDRIFSGTSVRAIDTAKPIREVYQNVPYQEIADLNERSKGESEGMDKDDFAKKYPEIIAAWDKEEDPQVSGGESFSDVEKRVLPIIESHLKEHAGETLLYISHGNVIRVLFGAFLNTEPRYRSRIAVDYCTLNSAEYDHERNRWSVTCLNGKLI